MARSGTESGSVESLAIHMMVNKSCCVWPCVHAIFQVQLREDVCLFLPAMTSTSSVMLDSLSRPDSESSPKKSHREFLWLIASHGVHGNPWRRRTSRRGTRCRPSIRQISFWVSTKRCFLNIHHFRYKLGGGNASYYPPQCPRILASWDTGTFYPSEGGDDHDSDNQARQFYPTPITRHWHLVSEVKSSISFLRM